MTMMNNGGPAFPIASDYGADGCGVAEGSPGMTLRDWFAGECNPEVYMPAESWFAREGKEPTVGELAGYIAEIRYIEADDMLAARAKGDAE